MHETMKREGSEDCDERTLVDERPTLETIKFLLNCLFDGRVHRESINN